MVGRLGKVAYGGRCFFKRRKKSHHRPRTEVISFVGLSSSLPWKRQQRGIVACDRTYPPGAWKPRKGCERREREGKGRGKEGYRGASRVYQARLHRPRIDECFSKSRRSGEELKRGKALPVSERRIERCVSDTPQIGGIFPDVFIALLSTTDPPRCVLATSRRVEGEWRWRARLRVENREILGCGELVLRARIKTRGQIFVLEREREREGGAGR